MSRWSVAAVVFFASGCAYVTKTEFDEFWDVDGDGWGFEEDCDDNNALVFPGAPDKRGDGCDADCGVQLDSDYDDWPDDNDCAPEDPSIYPCATEASEYDSVDNDCDFNTTSRTDECSTDDPAHDVEAPDAGCVSVGGS